MARSSSRSSRSCVGSAKFSTVSSKRSACRLRRAACMRSPRFSAAATASTRAALMSTIRSSAAGISSSASKESWTLSHCSALAAAFSRATWTALRAARSVSFSSTALSRSSSPTRSLSSCTGRSTRRSCPGRTGTLASVVVLRTLTHTTSGPSGGSVRRPRRSDRSANSGGFVCSPSFSAFLPGRTSTCSPARARRSASPTTTTSVVTPVGRSRRPTISPRRMRPGSGAGYAEIRSSVIAIGSASVTRT